MGIFCISPTVSLQTSPELEALQQYLLEGPQELSTAKFFHFITTEGASWKALDSSKPLARGMTRENLILEP